MSAKQEKQGKELQGLIENGPSAVDLCICLGYYLSKGRKSTLTVTFEIRERSLNQQLTVDAYITGIEKVTDSYTRITGVTRLGVGFNGLYEAKSRTGYLGNPKLEILDSLNSLSPKSHMEISEELKFPQSEYPLGNHNHFFIQPTDQIDDKLRIERL